MKSIIRFKNVSKVYRLKNAADNFALKDISFELHEGDRLGLIGLNGSGKSTLLKILSGYTKPTHGEVIAEDKVTTLAGFDSLLHPDLTGAENIRLQLRLLNFSSSMIADSMDEIIAFSGLGDYVNEPVKTYSAGMMLRLTFSVFKVATPRILLLDEVLSAGDILFQRKVDEMMLHHFKTVPVIIMASHQLGEISRYCNKCIILNKGEIEFSGTVNEALKEYENRNLYKIDESLRNNRINANSYAADKTEYKYSEPVRLTVEYTKLTDEHINLVLFIRNSFGNVLTDCEIYREHYKEVADKKGSYKTEIIIPPCMLSPGNYFADLFFGNGIDDILIIKQAIIFDVKPDEWEKDKLWNLQPVFGVRPQLLWEKKRTGNQ